jgi:hypothetical protein
LLSASTDLHRPRAAALDVVFPSLLALTTKSHHGLRSLSILGATTANLTTVVEMVTGSTQSLHETSFATMNAVYVYIASFDADPASIQENTFCGSPIVMFQDDDVTSLLGSVGSVHMPIPSLSIPSIMTSQRGASIVQLVDPMSQLLSGFEALFAKQDQAQIDDRAERRLFESAIQSFMTP